MTTEMNSEQDEADEVAQKVVVPMASKAMKSSSSQNELQRFKGHQQQFRSGGPAQAYNYMSTGKTQPAATIRARVQTGRPAATSVDQPLILQNATQ